MKRGRAHLTGEHFTHRYLWHCSLTLDAQASREEGGSAAFELAALLFVYLAFEAYLNYLGPRVCPEEWKDERKSFGAESKNRFRGTLGKLRLVADRTGLVLDTGTRPYQTIAELDRRRDRI